MTKGWTEERRRKAAARCRANKPWEKSTGPKTPAGKMRASLNALKHGGHSCDFKNARMMLKLNREFLAHYEAFNTTDFIRHDLVNELIKRVIMLIIQYLIKFFLCVSVFICGFKIFMSFRAQKCFWARNLKWFMEFPRRGKAALSE